MWFTLLYQPLLNGLIFFYRLFGNLGLAIIVMTVVLRLLLLPLTLPSLKATQKIKELAPELEKLKKKFGKDKQAFAKAQLDLYKKHGANPAAGCLPQIVQLVVLIAFFQAFNQVLRGEGDIITRLNEVLYPALQFTESALVNTRFLWLELTQPDTFMINTFKLPGLFLIGAAVTQLISSKMMAPTIKKEEKIAEKTPSETDDLAVTMQKQMTYLFPFMTIVIGYTFPSGLVLYWLMFSLTTVIQQLLLNRKK